MRVHPRRILAVTFTNKAAREMRDRVVALLGETARSVTLGTFHSVCARILRIDGGPAGVEPEFTIFDSADQQALMRAVLEELAVDPRTFAPPPEPSLTSPSGICSVPMYSWLKRWAS